MVFFKVITTQINNENKIKQGVTFSHDVLNLQQIQMDDIKNPHFYHCLKYTLLPVDQNLCIQ